MKLLEARNLAEWIRDNVLAEFCERVEIAGSIRRARSEVGDIDFVVLAKPGKRDALREPGSNFREVGPVAMNDRSRMRLQRRCRRRISIAGSRRFRMTDFSPQINADGRR